MSVLSTNDSFNISHEPLIDALSEPLIDALGEKDQEMLVIGLTGKVGTDLSSVVDLLTGDAFKSTIIQPYLPKVSSDQECRDLRNVQRFLRLRWKPFASVSINAALISFLFDIEDHSKLYKI